jgi:hypothetical protein
LGATSVSSASILASDPNAMGGSWQGIARFQSSPMPIVTVDVEYAVYAPGQFNLTFPGGDPSNGAQYVYAYQIFNEVNPHPYPAGPGYVSRFSVGLSGRDEQAANIGWIPNPNPPAGLLPNNFGFGPTTAGWDYAAPQLTYLSRSVVLLYTSPFSPELDSSSVTGSYAMGATVLLPSPTPEPMTLALVVAGMSVLLLRRRRPA